MTQRRVRAGRQVYGRMEQPRRKRTQWRPPAMALWQRRLVMLVVAAVVVAWALQRSFAITDVQVAAGGRADAVQFEALKLVHGSLGQGNLLTLNEAKLASNLQQVDPVLRSVQIHRRWFHTLQVTAVLKQPSLGWTSGNQQYVLDRDGTAIGALPTGSGLPAVTDNTNLPVQIGQQVAPAQFVAFVDALAPALGQVGISARGYSISDTTLDLTVATGKGYVLILDTSRAVGDEIADLKAVQAILTAAHATPTAYIDLRVAGKAYYK